MEWAFITLFEVRDFFFLNFAALFCQYFESDQSPKSSRKSKSFFFPEVKVNSFFQLFRKVGKSQSSNFLSKS